MSGFESRSRAALADPHKRANVPRFAEKAADNRARGFEGVDLEALRTAGEAARSRAIADLPALLDSLQEKLEAAGAVLVTPATDDLCDGVWAQHLAAPAR